MGVRVKNEYRDNKMHFLDSLFELPANFCDMCGTRFNVQTVTEKPELEHLSNSNR